MVGVLRWLLVALSCAAALAQDGGAIYRERCAGCHDAPTGRVPPVSALRTMDAAAIRRALVSGTMRTQAVGLSEPQLGALVAFLAVSNKPATVGVSVVCKGDEKPLAGGARWSGWGVDEANTRFQPGNAAGLVAADVPKLKLKWAFSLGAGTAVAGGRVFTADLTGALYSLDAASGCTRWKFEAGSPLRSGIVVAGSVVYFGTLKATAFAVDAATGTLIWKAQADEHFAAMITGAPMVHGGTVYVPVASYEEILPPNPKYECCTFRGSVVAFDAATGKRLWKTYTIQESARPTAKSKAGTQLHGPSGAGVWSSPTFDVQAGVIYVATGDNYSEPATGTSDAILALDAKTGRIVWTKQLTAEDVFNNGCVTPGKPNCAEKPGPDFDFGQPPILVAVGGSRRALVIGQKSGVVHALDPDRTGEILWQTRVGQGGSLGGVQWGSASDGKNAYVAVSDIRLVVQDSGLGVDPKRGGGLVALEVATGKVVWSAERPDCGERKNCSPAQSAAVSAIKGVVFSGSEDGHLRAYSAVDGTVVWEVDTAREYPAVNGGKARGGSLDVAGAVIAGGIVYVNSGYGQWGGMPGNVLLAFSVDGK